MVKKEIERKFLVKSKPKSSTCIDTSYIEQGYLSVTQDIRIRKQIKSFKTKQKVEYYLIIKSDGNMIREEEHISIQHNTFIDLSKDIKGFMIEKVRRRYNIGNGLIAEFDIYKSIPDLIVVEVEFETEENANDFIPPDWFGEEITNNPYYKNKNLAKL